MDELKVPFYLLQWHMYFVELIVIISKITDYKDFNLAWNENAWVEDAVLAATITSVICWITDNGDNFWIADYKDFNMACLTGFRLMTSSLLSKCYI